jgi:hypothetical protein
MGTSMDKQLPVNEREYIRMKVGDVLMVCLEDASVIPIQKLVESLVIIGPESLDILREILSEISIRRAQVHTDQQQVFHGFHSSLESLGVQFKTPSKMNSFYGIRPVHILNSLKRNGILDEAIQNQCLQILVDSRELMFDFRTRLDLLDRIEQYLLDWTWAVLYLSSHQQTGWTYMQ